MSSKITLKRLAAKELEEKIAAYFEKCREDDEPVTITGLALALNMSREELKDCAQDEACVFAIKQAILRVQNAYEKRLIKRGNTGDVFALKTFGWTDKPETEKTIKIKKALVLFEDEQDAPKNSEREKNKEEDG